MTSKPRESLLFRLVIVASAALLVTVLGMIAAAFAPPESSLTRFFDRNGLSLLGVEVLGILGFGILAMASDQPPSNGDEPGPPHTQSPEEKP